MTVESLTQAVRANDTGQVRKILATRPELVNVVWPGTTSTGHSTTRFSAACRRWCGCSWNSGPMPTRESVPTTTPPAPSPSPPSASITRLPPSFRRRKNGARFSVGRRPALGNCAAHYEPAVRIGRSEFWAAHPELIQLRMPGNRRTPSHLIGVAIPANGGPMLDHGADVNANQRRCTPLDG
jgi:hypothetical protein